MAIIFIDGFDLYSTVGSVETGLASQWVPCSTSQMSLVTGRFDVGQAVAMIGATTARRIDYWTPVGSTFAVGVAVRIDDLDSIDRDTRVVELITGSGSGSTQCGIGILLSTGELFAYNGALTNIGTATGVTLTQGQWHYIEIAVTIANSGTFVAHLDGVEILNLSGVDTQGQSGNTANRLRLYGTNDNNAEPAQWIYDDVYLKDDDTLLGPCRVNILRPHADTADADWTPENGGDNFAEVDDLQIDGDVSFVASDTPGDLDLYDFGSLGITPDTIHAVDAVMVAKKDDVATRQVRIIAKSNLTTDNGDTRALTASYLWFHAILEQDPDTTSAWDTAGVNALQVGPEVVS